MEGWNSLLPRCISLIIMAAVLISYQGVQSIRAQAAENAERLYMEQKKASETYKDGQYEGEGQGFGGPIIVSVTVEGGNIEDIEVLSHKNEDAAYFDTAVSLIQEILNKQSTDVDTVSGATFSSKGIISAVEDALNEAGN